MKKLSLLFLLLITTVVIISGCSSHDPRTVVYDPSMLSENDRKSIISDACLEAVNAIYYHRGKHKYEFHTDDISFKNIDQRDKDNLPTMTVDTNLTTVKYISVPLNVQISIDDGKKYDVKASVRFFKTGDKPLWKTVDVVYHELVDGK